MSVAADKTSIPENWDRSGLPPWTYHSEELTELEKEVLFRRHWQLACHVSDVPEKGSYITFDLAGDRAIIMRGDDNEVRAFHNLCRHRGSRVLPKDHGRCKNVMVCPFHGWSYNLDGTLRRPYLPESLPPLDSKAFGLKPIEMEIWMGFVFIRLQPGTQGSVSDMFIRHIPEIDGYQTENMIPTSNQFWTQEIDVNWKAVRDVDNEGYHVPLAHPALQDLYGPNYYDEPIINGTSRSFATFTEPKGRYWSVRAYKNLLPENSNLPPANRRAWLYIGVFPNLVIGFYPDSVMFYQEFPLSAGNTVQRSAVYKHPNESRELRVSRYLSERIDRITFVEDTQLIKWTCEAMESSAFDGIILSDREFGVRSYHDELRSRVPVIGNAEAPATGTLARINAELSG